MVTQPSSSLLAIATLLTLAKASALTCQANADNCVVNGNTATCSGSTDESAEVINCSSIICDPNSAADKSCYDYTLSNAADVECSGWQACLDSTILNVKNLQCSDNSACSGSSIFNVNTLLCTADTSCRASISDVDRLQCWGDSSCQEADITNVDTMECLNDSACQQSTMSNVENLVCTGDAACHGSTISNIPSGGTVDCLSSEDTDYVDACSTAVMTSTNPFTVTCQGTPGVSSTDCRDGSITSPGGSVFCYGGSSTSGVCDGLKITDSIGCIICGNEEACRGVKLVDSNGSNVATIPNKEVFVSDQCEESDVLAYLNKVHPDGNCYDAADDGACDVVMAFCNDDSNCISNFEYNGPSWVLLGLTYGGLVLFDVDPDSLPSSDSHNKVGQESWIVGSIMIVIFLLVMVVIVCYFGKKNEWACCKKACGCKEADVDGKDQEEEGQEDSQTASVKDNHDVVEDV